MSTGQTEAAVHKDKSKATTGSTHKKKGPLVSLRRGWRTLLGGHRLDYFVNNKSKATTGSAHKKKGPLVSLRRSWRTLLGGHRLDYFVSTKNTNRSPQASNSAKHGRAGSSQKLELKKDNIVAVSAKVENVRPERAMYDVSVDFKLTNGNVVSLTVAKLIEGGDKDLLGQARLSIDRRFEEFSVGVLLAGILGGGPTQKISGGSLESYRLAFNALTEAIKRAH